MVRVKATVSYDGTDFSGWQKQKNENTVQKCIEGALAKVLKKEISICGAGRTDAGVHALAQCVHFDIESERPLFELCAAINHNLVREVRIKKCCYVDGDFHARRSAKEKTYVYRMTNQSVVDPIFSKYVYRVNKKLCEEKIVSALPLFCGKKDFKAYANSNKEGVAAYSSVRSIYSFTFTKDDNDTLIFSIVGDGFLYKMVRNIVGTVVYFASGKLTEKDIVDSFVHGDRTKIGPTICAKGLVLEDIKY